MPKGKLSAAVLDHYYLTYYFPNSCRVMSLACALCEKIIKIYQFPKRQRDGNRHNVGGLRRSMRQHLRDEHAEHVHGDLIGRLDTAINGKSGETQ